MGGARDSEIRLFQVLPDIAADMINVDLSLSNPLTPSDVRVIDPHSALRSGKKHFSQDRDVFIKCNRGEVMIGFVGFENENDPVDEFIAMRVLPYDAACYREQYNNYRDIIIKNRKIFEAACTKARQEARENGGGPIDEDAIEQQLWATEQLMPLPDFYPVVTLVYDFSTGPSKIRPSLRACFSPTADPDFVSASSDYPIHVIRVADLSPEKFSKYTSDWKFVVQFIAASKKKAAKQDYSIQGSSKELNHPDEFANLMETLTGKRMLNKWLKETTSDGKEIPMIAVFEELANAVAEEKKDEWLAEGEIKVYASWIRKGRLTVQEAADELQISPDEFRALAKQYKYSLRRTRAKKATPTP